MRLSTFRPATAFASLVALGSFAFAPVTAAQTGCGDDSCPAGFECLTGPTGCGGVCEVPADGGEPVCYELECDPEPYTYCARATCTTDSDCGEEMVCHTTEQNLCPRTDPPSCAGDDCEDTDYEDTDEADCEQTQLSQCAYPHELPCDTDAECGEGYACVASQSCWCSAGSPEPGAPEGAPSADPPPPAGTVPATSPSPPDQGECGCEPTGSNHCQMQDIECESDADCPAQWSCLEAAAPCWVDSDGNSGCQESTLRCYPDGTYGSGGLGNAPGNPDPIGESDSPDQAPIPAGPATPVEPPVGEPPVGEPPAGDGNGHGSNGNGGPGGHPGSGNHLGLWATCSVDGVPATGSSGSPWALSALALGAALLRRRRR